MSKQSDLRKPLSLWGGAGVAGVWMLFVLVQFSLHPPPRGRVPYARTNALNARLAPALVIGFASGSLGGYALAVFLRRRHKAQEHPTA